MSFLSCWLMMLLGCVLTLIGLLVTYSCKSFMVIEDSFVFFSNISISFPSCILMFLVRHIYTTDVCILDHNLFNQWFLSVSWCFSVLKPTLKWIRLLPHSQIFFLKRFYYYYYVHVRFCVWFGHVDAGAYGGLWVPRSWILRQLWVTCTWVLGAKLGFSGRAVSF